MEFLYIKKICSNIIIFLLQGRAHEKEWQDVYNDPLQTRARACKCALTHKE